MDRLNGVDSYNGTYGGGEGPIDDLASQMLLSKPPEKLDEFAMAQRNKPDPMMQMIMQLMGNNIG